MTADPRLDVDFTALLYGVVTANALQFLEFGWSLANYALLFALVIILDDWVDYTLSTDIAESSPRKYLASYVIDITTLVVWYLASIAPMSALDWYLVLVFAFFVLQGLWDVAVMDQYGVREVVLVRPYWQLAALYAALLAVHTVVYELPPTGLITACFAIFSLRKGYFWYRWFSADRNGQAFTAI